MSQLLPVNADEGNDFYIEVIPATGQSGITQRSREVSEKLTNTEFKQMIRQAVMPACKTFVEVWQELNQPMIADSAEVEFNLGFTASGSAVIVQASGQASFKVKVSWKFDTQSQKALSHPAEQSMDRNFAQSASNDEPRGDVGGGPNDPIFLTQDELKDLEGLISTIGAQLAAAEKDSKTPPKKKNRRHSCWTSSIFRSWRYYGKCGWWYRRKRFLFQKTS